MSGGAMEYIYYRLEEASTMVEDMEIKDLLMDLSELLHDEEWYKSYDTDRRTYVKSLEKFKKKWFKTPRTERLKQYIDKACDETKTQLYELIGVEDD